MAETKEEPLGPPPGEPDPEDSAPPPPPEPVGDFWETAADAKSSATPMSPKSGTKIADLARSNTESQLMNAPAALTKETDGNVIAQWLETFFKDLYVQSPEVWAKSIAETLLFPLMQRPLIVKAFLYGQRSKSSFSKTIKQEWFRWVLPLFEYSTALQYTGADFTAERFAEALSLRARNEYDSIGILIVVQLVHWTFQNESASSFAQLLAEIKSKFEALGWTEECAKRVGTVLKACLSKLSTCQARLKSDQEHPWWDNIVALIAAIEDLCFYSPTYGFTAKPDDCIGVHVSNTGCADVELLSDTRNFLNGLGIRSAADSSLATVVSLDETKAQRKTNKTREENLRSCSQFAAAAFNWAAALEEAVKLNAQFEKVDEAKLTGSTAELIDVLSKRPRFSRCTKKQAATALEGALTQKPVAMLDPWTSVQVMTTDSPEGKSVTLSEVWRQQRTVVYLVRRFGCPLCLHQATILMQLNAQLAEHGAKLVAVGNGDFNLAKQFKEGLQWPGEVYLDPDSTSYKAIHLKRLTSWEVAKRYFTNFRVLTWFKNNPHKAQNQDGDGMQTGGVFILGPGENSPVIFSFKEIDNDPLSFPIPEAIVNACSADSQKKKSGALAKLVEA